MTPTGSTYMAMEIHGLRQLLAEKDAEIERLKVELEAAQTLITELCDALKLAHPDNPTPSLPATLEWFQKYPDLIQRARKAAK